jgi:hypothetical protein
MKEINEPNSLDRSAKFHEIGTIRDLADFYLHWHEFRAIATRVLARGRLESEEEKLVVTWLVRLADSVGEKDLG